MQNPNLGQGKKSGTR